MSEDIERLHDSILGETDQLIEIANGSMLTALSSRMAEQSSRYIDIVSRHLDPPAYDNERFVAAVKRLALSSKHARIRIMIIDARPLITTGRRLIELASRLPKIGRAHV